MPKLFQLPKFFLVLLLTFTLKKYSISPFWINLGYAVLKLTPQAQDVQTAEMTKPWRTINWLR